ncbi:MAG: hypothetical protein CL946_05155 [Ectothiorhodospiraceae bacterium]|nr:hypothetical protein [Ectothiorhodospiraceae bacterium]
MKSIPILLFAALIAAFPFRAGVAQDTDDKVVVIEKDDDAKAWLGVYLKSVTKYTVKDGEEPVESSEGAIVDRVIDDSPAEEAGLEKGDLITAIDGTEIKTTKDLTSKLGEMKPGEKVALTIDRDGNERQIDVELGTRPDKTFHMSRVPRAPRAPHAPKMYRKALRFNAQRGPKLGVQVETLNKELGEYFQAPNGKGVLVKKVMDYEDSPAKQAGLQAGDVIVKINLETVEDRHDIESALSGMKEGEELKIDVIRKGQRKTLNAKVREDIGANGERHMMLFGDMGAEFDGEDFRFMGPGDVDIDIDVDKLLERVGDARVHIRTLKESLGEQAEEMNELKEELEQSIRIEIERQKDLRDEREDEIEIHEQMDTDGAREIRTIRERRVKEL